MVSEAGLDELENYLEVAEITQVMEGVPKSAWLEALAEIKEDYARDGRGLQVVEVAAGYQITTRPEYNDWIMATLLDRSPSSGATQT